MSQPRPRKDPAAPPLVPTPDPDTADADAPQDARERTSDPLDQLLERYLYGVTLVERDDARRALAAQGSSEQVRRLIELLTGPRRDARRRASFMLIELPPALVQPQLRAQLEPSAREALSEAALIEVARLLSHFTRDEEPCLRPLLDDPRRRVRRAALSTATPAAGLAAALADPEVSIAERAAALLLQRPEAPPAAAIETGLETHPQLGPLLSLARRAGLADEALRAAAAAGERAPIAYLAASEEALLSSLLGGANAVDAAWRLGPESEALAALVEAPDARLRAAAARRLAVTHSALRALASDPEPAVAWLARRRLSGRYDEAQRAALAAPHEALQRASAQPPYGIRSYDSVGEVPRAKAALALCHGRFESNLGVAIRSAEAAGLAEVFLLGQSKVGISAARGVDRAIKVEQLPDEEQLIAMARRRGYQLVSIQQAVGSEPVQEAEFPPAPLFLLGAEDRGISPSLLQASDLVVEIPLFGEIDSLNVAAAATVALFQWRFQQLQNANTPPIPR